MNKFLSTFLTISRLGFIAFVFLFTGAVCACAQTSSSKGAGLSVQNAGGLQLVVAEDSAQPRLRVILPGHSPSDRTIEVLFPEHVTALKSGNSVVERLYLPASASADDRPQWRRVGRSLQYERDLPHDIHLLARATLENDGVRFHYEFTNRSAIAYDMIYAVTDPRLRSILHDVRLERTYVHHANGFELLASETPERLTMPLDKWLPARYLVSFTWPVPARLVERRDDAITYYNKSRVVDQPFIATLSTEGGWLVASFTRNTGNVWSNPELTCQHVDPQTSLKPGQQGILEVKILVLRGSLQDALRRAIRQRQSLK
jgi:hypothetical protein